MLLVSQQMDLFSMDQPALDGFGLLCPLCEEFLGWAECCLEKSPLAEAQRLGHHHKTKNNNNPCYIQLKLQH